MPITFFSFLFSLLLTSSLCFSITTDDTEFTVCIDGGGTKTSLTILDAQGIPILLSNKNQNSTTIYAGASNINGVKFEGVREIIFQLFDNLAVGIEKIPFTEFIQKSAVIGGFGGLGREDDQQSVKNIFLELGFLKNHLLIQSDAELALNLLNDNEIMLIAGTGSICFGKFQGKEFRAGGLGRLIGDEGSAYYIGINGIKAGLEAELGWGAKTSLLVKLKEILAVKELKSLIRPIHEGTFSPAEIAKISPIVFQEAFTGDHKALEIIVKAANELANLLLTMINHYGFRPQKIYLMGGLFQSNRSEDFIQLIEKKLIPALSSMQIFPMFINISGENPAVLASKKIRGY